MRTQISAAVSVWRAPSALGLLLMICSCAAPTTPAPAIEARRLNVLWIVADDCGPDLACYGTPAVRTPNLDRLASEGVRFTRAHTTSPVCSPSRSALITGMYQTTIGAQDHRSHRDDGYRLPDGVRPITDLFRDAGYYTANVTKIAPGLKGDPDPDVNFTPDRPLFDGDDWAELKSHAPFYAQVNLTPPHRGGPWRQARANPDLPRVDPAKVALPPYYPDHPITRDDYANYLDAVQLLDQQVGRVLKMLEYEGLAEDTVVIFFGDNGRPHVRDKQWLYDGGTHVPLIVRWPGVTKPGTVREDPVSGIDVSATSLAAAGISPPKTMQGRPLLGPRAAKPREFVVTARDRCDETPERIRCVRSADYSYIRNDHAELPYTQPNEYKDKTYPVLALMRKLHADGKLTPEQDLFMAPHKPPEELYDLRNDPHEVRNLAASPEHQAVLKQMRQRLANWERDTGDRGARTSP